MMFTSKRRLEERGGPEERLRYIRELCDEFKKTKSYDCKKQVLANLTNFAYDPINYEFFKKARVLDIFLNELSEGNSEELLHFAVGGLCNACLDPENREYIIRHNGIVLISEYVNHRNIEISLNALTCVIYMITSENKPLFTTEEILSRVKEAASSENPRLKNLAAVYYSSIKQNK